MKADEVYDRSQPGTGNPHGFGGNAWGGVKRVRLLAVFALFAHLVTMATVDAQNVEARLVADVSAVKPGGVFTLGVHLTIETGWYVYWRNPGDSGMPTDVNWELPPGFTAEDVQWPAPAPHREGELVSYGYEREVVLMARIRAPMEPEGDPLRFAARVSWLACKEICVPGDARIELSLPVRPDERASPSDDAELLRRFRRLVPVRSPGWTFALRDRTLTLFPPLGFDAGGWRDSLFLALDPELMNHAGRQRWSSPIWNLWQRQASLSVPLMPGQSAPDTVRGVLIRSASDARGALDIEARIAN